MCLYRTSASQSANGHERVENQKLSTMGWIVVEFGNERIEAGGVIVTDKRTWAGNPKESLPTSLAPSPRAENPLNSEVPGSVDKF